jgi:hypothetical protein
MTDATQFQLTNPAVPKAYDEFFVPSLFVPWAVLLLDGVRLRPGDCVLDVATGPGTAARLAAQHVGYVYSMRRLMEALQLLLVLLVLLTSYGICGVLPASVKTGSAVSLEPDPLAVVQALMDAEHIANLDAAMALFAADAFILNVTGWKTANREELTWFINTETWMREDYALNHHRVSGDRVTWDEAAAESFYQDIGVAPVQFVFEATIRGGKIKSIIAHLPAGEIDRISKACRAQAKEPLIHGRSCSEFVQLVKAHTKRHSGASRAQ